MKNRPAISVVLPVYNAEAYLPLALSSLYHQTFRDFEIIAVNDGSNDLSHAILQGYAMCDSRMVIVSRPNTGIVGALNDGVRMAQAPLIARMDADDLAFPDRFQKQLDWMNTHSKCVAVGSATLHIDSDGDPIRVDQWTESHAGLDAQLLKGKGGLPHPAAMIRTQALRDVGGYREEYEWIEDKDLWLRLGEVGELANLPDVLLAYRLHTKSVCAHFEREMVQQSRMQSLLRETYARRKIRKAIPSQETRTRRGKDLSELRRGWILSAAKSGFEATARKQIGHFVRESRLGLSASTVLFRAYLAIAKARIFKLAQRNAQYVNELRAIENQVVKPISTISKAA